MTRDEKLGLRRSGNQLLRREAKKGTKNRPRMTASRLLRLRGEKNRLSPYLLISDPPRPKAASTVAVGRPAGVFVDMTEPS